ncbi:CO dehydrogenase/acetyl-CoA synthase complex subunit alpha [Archaeoglobus sp.]
MMRDLSFENIEIKIGEFVMGDKELLKIIGNEEAKTVRDVVEKAVKEEKKKGVRPHILDFRHWDMLLLERFEPIYAPMLDFCNLCTMGPCDLSFNKEGACGIDLKTQKARIVALACSIGASAHATHGRHLLEEMIEEFGEDHPIDLGLEVDVKTPNISLVLGIEPKTLGDLREVASYIEQEITRVLHTIHTGQEESYLDYESKALHVSMIDHVGMELADIVQISCLGYPKGDPDAPLIESGIGVLDLEKPVILVIGHNVVPARYIDDYLKERDLDDLVVVAGICCTAIDTTRYDPKAKIVGSLSYQLRMIRQGFADVVVVDEQCIRADLLRECSKAGIPLFTTSEASARGCPDLTHEDADKIVEKIVSGEIKGALIRDYEKLAKVVVKTAFKIKRRKKGIDVNVEEEVKKCVACGRCVDNCPHSLPIDTAMKRAKEGDYTMLKELDETCIACGRCEQVCHRNVRIVDVIMRCGEVRKSKIRAGRGPVKDSEIRKVGQPIVMGTIPGVIAPVGCPNYPKARRELVEIIEEFLKRKYIVVTTGCHAMDLGLESDLYERYGGDFDAGCLVNIGSCVANSHISGAVIKIAKIFAQRDILGNYVEIADYILNRVGAVGLAWGAMSQKAASIATGFNRLGVPVVASPHCLKYRRGYVGKFWKREKWWVYDIKTKRKVYVEPCPDALLVCAETKEEAIVLLARLCFRPADTYLGRQIKLTHYLELGKKYLGCYPDDWHLFVRTEQDLPIKMRDELLKILEEEHGWKIDWDKKRIVEGPIRKYDPGFNPTIVKEVYEKYAGEKTE